MKKKFGPYLTLNRKEFFTTLLIPPVLFAVIHVVTLIALAVSGEQTSILVSGAGTSIVLWLWFFALGYSRVMVELDYELSFGCTRREMLKLGAGRMGLHLLLSSGLTLLLTFLEIRFMPSLWQRWFGFAELRMEALRIPEGSVQPADVLFVSNLNFPWWIILVVPASGLVIGIIAGFLTRRFGRKLFWMLWGLFMVTVVADSWGNLPESVFVILGIAFLILLPIGLIWSVRELLHISCEGT